DQSGQLTRRAPVGHRFAQEHVAAWVGQRHLPAAALGVMIATRQRHDADAARTVKRRPKHAAATILRDDVATLPVHVPGNGRRGLPTASPYPVEQSHGVIIPRRAEDRPIPTVADITIYIDPTLFK